MYKRQVLGEEGVQLHLVHHGGDLGIEAQVGQSLGIEIAYAKGPNFTRLVQFLHGPPGAVVIVHGLVDEVQIQVVKSQFCLLYTSRCV